MKLLYVTSKLKDPRYSSTLAFKLSTVDKTACPWSIIEYDSALTKVCVDSRAAYINAYPNSLPHLNGGSIHYSASNTVIVVASDMDASSWTDSVIGRRTEAWVTELEHLVIDIE